MIQDTEQFKMDITARLEQTLSGKVKLSKLASIAKRLVLQVSTLIFFSDYPMLYAPSLRAF